MKDMSFVFLQFPKETTTDIVLVVVLFLFSVCMQRYGVKRQKWCEHLCVAFSHIAINCKFYSLSTDVDVRLGCLWETSENWRSPDGPIALASLVSISGWEFCVFREAFKDDSRCLCAGRTVQYQRVACRRRLQAMKPVVASVLHVGYARLPHVAARASGHPFTGCSPLLTSPWTHDQACNQRYATSNNAVYHVYHIFSATASEARPSPQVGAIMPRGAYGVFFELHY